MVLVMISSTTYDVISFNRLHSIKLQSKYVVMMKTKEKENTEDITKNNNVDGEE